MTQVKEMTNQQLNRALAVALGCQVEEHSGTVFFFTIRPNGKRLYHQLSDYAGDAAASLEVQTAACKANYELYVDSLANLFWGHLKGWDNSQYHREEIAHMFNATPRERAEAAYLTLGGE